VVLSDPVKPLDRRFFRARQIGVVAGAVMLEARRRVNALQAIKWLGQPISRSADQITG